LIFFFLAVGPAQNNTNIAVYPPISVAYAFYSFDGNVLDLYSLHNGKFYGGVANYALGYVATGSAINFTQSIPTWISIANPFNLSSTSFTIEAFILLQNYSIDANLVQFSSGMAMSIQQNSLQFVLNGTQTISLTAILSTNLWYHVAVVFNLIQQYLNVYISGQMVRQLPYSMEITSENENVTVTIGYGFQGLADQLAISLEAKTDDRILWDATVAAYYPFNGDNSDLLLDYGPNCVNASTRGTQPVPGPVANALNFIMSGAYYQAFGFTALGTPNYPFSVALWIRLENQSGIVLTIANPMACLFVLGIRSNDNAIIAYLPNSTNTNIGANIIGTPIANNQWVHVAFTWSSENEAQLYKNAAFQGQNPDATKLNNGYGEPMTVTLGMYGGKANCSGGAELDITQQFIGSVDEFYIFSRELQQDEIQKLMLPTNS
jgi:hypothetical protein